MRTTSFFYTCLLAFTATLAYIIGARLPAETLVIAAGVLTGVVAGVPISLLVNAAATRALLARYAAAQAASAAEQPDPEPQFIVLPAAQPAPAPAAPRPNRATPGAQADMPGARRFTIIGGTGKDD